MANINVGTAIFWMKQSSTSFKTRLAQLFENDMQSNVGTETNPSIKSPFQFQIIVWKLDAIGSGLEIERKWDDMNNFSFEKFICRRTRRRCWWWWWKRLVLLLIWFHFSNFIFFSPFYSSSCNSNLPYTHTMSIIFVCLVVDSHWSN